MEFFTISSKRFIVLLFTISTTCINYVSAQIRSASVSQGNTNRLVVNLSSRTTASNSNGWYLVGGSAEVKRLIGGSGTNTLTFELTDYVLPDDDFTLYYYQELGNAVSDGSKTHSAAKVPVSTNGINSYRGRGKVYYVSSRGASGSSGTSPSQPTTFSKAIRAAQAGDYVLLKRGETWNSPINIKNKRGSKDRYLTIGTYGSGRMPVISGAATTIEVRESHYVQVVGLEVRPRLGSRLSGARILGDSRYCKLRSLKAVGPKKNSDGTGTGSGISYSSASGSNKFPYHSIVMHCDVSGFKNGIYGYRIRGGGELCFNKVSYCAEDGIRAFNGDTDGIVIGHNEITKFSDDGIDLFNGSDIIVQYNKIHDPVYPRPNNANNGIKGGGASGSSASRDIIIRYNTIYNLSARGKSPNAITTNGAVSGEIYGNLCYNIDDNAIEITARQRNKSWKVYNNTAISNRASAFIVAPNNPNVTATNNIFSGAKSDIRVNGSSRVSGKNNILVNNKKAGNYSSRGDFRATTASLFNNYNRKDFRLKSSSPAINKGVSISNYKGDIVGKKMSGVHDIGCYEYRGQSAAPTPQPEPSPAPPTNSTSGLRYRYYQGNWNNLPNFGRQSVVKQGKVSNFSLSPRTRNEYFGMVFEGQLKIDKSGQYTFYTNADDGVKLFIKGQQVVSDDGVHPARERSGSIYLSAGLHSIKVEYFEKTGEEVLEVSYQGSGVSKQRIPDNKLFQSGSNPGTPPTNSTSGLRYRYYQGNWNNLPNFGRQSVVKQGKVSNFSLSPRTRNEYFGMVFEGQLKIDKSGQYTFYTNADDGVKLFIKGQQVVSDDGVHPARERSGSIYLSAGLHSIKVEYFEKTGEEVLEVSYQGSGISKQRIPDNKLFQPSSNQRTSVSNKSKTEGFVVADEVKTNVVAYPNPVQHELTIELPSSTEQQLEVKFIDVVGSVVWQENLTKVDTRLSVNLEQAGIRPGYYLLVVSSQGKVLYTNKILKE